MNRSRLLLIALFFLLCLPLSAVELDGRFVILLVGEHRSGDPDVEAIRKKVLEIREELGRTADQMPLVSMGFKDSDSEREYFERLGLSEKDAPILCVVEWGNPAKFGPKRVLDEAISRSATSDGVETIVNGFLTANGESPILTALETEFAENENCRLKLSSDLLLQSEAKSADLFPSIEDFLGPVKAGGESSVEFVVGTRQPGEAGLALIKYDRGNKANKRLRRMVKVFSRRVAAVNESATEAVEVELNGNRFYKIEHQSLSTTGARKRESYLHVPRGERYVLVFTLVDTPENFAESSPLFRQMLETVEFK